MRTFPAKDPSESRILGFDFTNDLGTGVTLTGTPTFSIADVSGVADPAVGSMFIGPPSLSGNIALQVCAHGVSEAIYSVTGTCPASNGEIITQGAFLPVILAYQQ